jgi:hypothetical protein
MCSSTGLNRQTGHIMNEIHLIARLAQGLTTGIIRAWAALAAGSRTIPFGDNGALLRELAARVAASKRHA